MHVLDFAKETREDKRTELYKTESLDGTKPNTNPKTNPNPNTNSNHKLILFSCLMIFRAPSPDLQSSLCGMHSHYIIHLNNTQ